MTVALASNSRVAVPQSAFSLECTAPGVALLTHDLDQVDELVSFRFLRRDGRLVGRTPRGELDFGSLHAQDAANLLKAKEILLLRVNDQNIPLGGGSAPLHLI